MNLQNQIDYLNGVFGVDMFDNCTVPDGLEMERVRGAIVMRCGLLTPLYSEPETQKAATEQFFFENQWNFLQILKVIEAEYNPIENVFEDTEESEGKTIERRNDIIYGHNTERQVSAENVSSYASDNAIIESGSDVNTGNEGEDRTLLKHRHGNIGVTSAQSLIEESLSLIDHFNPYKFIADLYEKQLIIGLY